MSNKVIPVSDESRIISLDILRGFALLGILLMNIQSFAMVGSAYINPMAYGNMEGFDKWVWILSHIFADQKFMSIFSILFGAGVLLFSEKVESKGGKPAGLHYRRTFWLLLIGLSHAYLLWYGDILVAYAICSLIVFLFRKASPKKLLIIGMCCFSVHSLIYIPFGMFVPYWPEEALADLNKSWLPSAEMIGKEVQAYRSGWLVQLGQRVPETIFMQTGVFFMVIGWRAIAMMFLGMALFKWDVLTGKANAKVYKRMALFGLLAGIPLIVFGVYQNFSHNWSIQYSMFTGSQYNYWGSLLLCLSYIGIVMLWIRSDKMAYIKKSLANVGKLALSNYLFQTIACTFFFYGHGLGYFGSLERGEQLLVVLGMWVVQVLLSNWYVTRFHYGPFEWMWRSLTYFKMQRFRRVLGKE